MFEHNPEENIGNADEGDTSTTSETLIINTGKNDAEDICEDEIEYIEVSPLLEQAQQKYFLPPHHRCAAHLLNLVASKDTGEAIKDAVSHIVLFQGLLVYLSIY